MNDRTSPVAQPTLTHRAEYVALVLIMAVLRWLPRRASRRVGQAIGRAVFVLAGRLRRIGDQNLRIAFPGLPSGERDALLRRTFDHLGQHVSEFCLMSRYTQEIAQGTIMRYEGLEHYLDARAGGKGVLVLTGHLGAWELSSFLHSLLGYPMSMVIRRLDNPLVDRMVNRIRCLHGNQVLHKDDFARGLLHAMAKGETVGILMDTNMTPPQGVFVPFFDVSACTASGLARVARKTGAAVIPGFLLWRETEQRYVLEFGEQLRIHMTDDADADALSNTALFAKVTEEYIRRCPDQWLWFHRRWKTRPTGEPPLYRRKSSS